MKHYWYIGVAVLLALGAAALISCAGSARTRAEGEKKMAIPDASRDPDEVIEEYLSRKDLPALAVAAVKGGELVYSRVAGHRRAGGPEPVLRGDAFHIGSDTKAMTALLAAMLVEEGKISWDSTVASILSGEVSYRAEYGPVSLELLLCHESGLPAELQPAAWASFFGAKEPVRAERKRMAESALSLPPRAKPGESFSYSNFNYVVAGLMLEKASGNAWEDLMRERLFEPLGMNGAGFGPPASEEAAMAGKADAPWGHSPEPIAPGPEADNPPALGPAGTVHATLDDMIAYLRLYLDGGLGPDGSRLASADSLARIAAPRLERYGLGWINLGSAEAPVLVHDGSNTMFYCSLVVIPALRLGVVVMTNRGDDLASTRAIELREYLIARYAR